MDGTDTVAVADGVESVQVRCFFFDWPVPFAAMIGVDEAAGVCDSSVISTLPSSSSSFFSSSSRRRFSRAFDEPAAAAAAPPCTLVVESLLCRNKHTSCMVSIIAVTVERALIFHRN